MKKYVLISGLFGLTGVSLGAFGAHALRGALETSGTLEAWKTAVVYQLIHAVALLSINNQQKTNLATGFQPFAITNICWSLGILLFSGSLYWLALGGPKWLGPVTPFGGLLLLAGWAGVVLNALKSSKTTSEQ